MARETGERTWSWQKWNRAQLADTERYSVKSTQIDNIYNQKANTGNLRRPTPGAQDRITNP